MSGNDVPLTSPHPPSRRTLVVRSVRSEAESIISIELADPAGSLLPETTAGAHIDVHLSGGMTRQYSLCHPPAERDRYLIAVLHEKDGRGGSAAMHKLKPGDSILVSGPRNHFALAGPEANHHLLLAGGIGIAPMMSMIAELEARAAEFSLHYCVRDPSRAAFLDKLEPLVSGGCAEIYFSQSDPSRRFDIKAALANPIPTQHVYVCGPPSFINEARRSVGAWAPHTVHFEQFSGDAQPTEDDKWDEVPFQVVLKNSGRAMNVPERCSILRVLMEAGIEVPSSCEAGFCGACITRYVDGEPIHRDTVLSDAERSTYTLICRARCRTPTLVLDL